MAQKQQKTTFDAAEICSVTEKLFKAEMPQLTNFFIVKCVRGRVVEITVLNSSAAAELRLGEGIVLAELQKRYPQILKLRYTIGPLKPDEELDN